MTMEELIRAVAQAYKNPVAADADRNGNTRLAALRKRFHLSSLKVQKILVTAGVYEPVKSDTSYEEITELRKSGKSVEEIMELTGLSSATVSACFPYERSVYNADRIGAEVSSDSRRKRKQRSSEEMKRTNARDMLQNNVTDETFWKAVQEHGGETFISTKGERYTVNAEFTVLGKNGRQDLHVRPDHGSSISFSKDEVLGVLHNALELKAAGKETDPGFFEQTESLPYVYPMLVFFGIILGDKAQYTTRRTLPDSAVCSCCGRRAVYTVSTYADLVRIAAEIRAEERSKWTAEERKQAECVEAFSGCAGRDETAKKDNAAIRAFDLEGERRFCALCAETIRMALEEGELPHSSETADFSSLPLETAEAGFDLLFEGFPENVRYEDRGGRRYDSDMAGDENGSCIFFYRETDKEGTEHFFACYELRFPDHASFEAVEVHKLTKAGKFARDYTGTDYEFQTGFLIHAEDDVDEDEEMRKTYTGFLELANKIRAALQNPTLDWREGAPWFENAITIGNRQCFLRSSGQMQEVYVDEESVQGRDWQGGRHGYRIDGILFTAEEVALMASRHEGWNLQYRFADPYDEPLHAGEYLMPMRLGEKELAAETSDLLNLFTSEGQFMSDHDKRNFGILFEKTVLKKLKLYHESNPRGYGKLAGMKLIKQLQWIEGTECQAQQIRKIIRM